jgi:MFS family permease
VADSVPLYPLYALLFAHTGLSTLEISSLFAIWTVVAVVGEVPAGALADRFSRRGALVAAGVLQALGFLLWTVAPGYAVFAGGFVLWGVGGTLVSGATEALLYDGLTAAGAEDQFTRVLGRVEAAGFVAQIPATAGAFALFSLGGYTLVGWGSVGICLAAAALATRLPEAPRQPSEETGSYLATLRTGVVEAAREPAVRTAVLAVAGLSGVDAIDEYFPLMARSWGIPERLVPLGVLVIMLAGAAGAWLGGLVARVRLGGIAAALVTAAALLAAAALLDRAASLLLAAAFYVLFRIVLVQANGRLQERIEADARATVTSVAALGTEVSALAFIGVWSLGGAVSIAVCLAAAGTWLVLRPPKRA